MSPAHVLQPTYERLKSEIIGGFWAQNVRLEAARIADHYGVSATPVRDSLNLLVGEGLITFQPGEGYRTRIVTERDLSDLLVLNALLLRTSLSVDRNLNLRAAPEGLDHSHEAAIGQFFEEIARSSGNRAFVEVVRRLNDRLHQLRRNEHLVFADLETEFQALLEAWKAGSPTAADLLAAYHERRVSMVRELAVLLP